MIRVLVFLVFLAFVALGAAWLADHPGEVVLTWQDYRISTPLSVAVAALVAVVTALIIAWSVVRFIFKLPDLVTIASRARRRAAGSIRTRCMSRLRATSGAVCTRNGSRYASVSQK